MIRSRYRLQWGRRPRTAEIVRYGERRSQVHDASMGPPSEDGGNTSGEMVAPIINTLQWGRRPRTAEMPGPVALMRAALKLQWGRRPRTAEIPDPGTAHLGQRVLQWGRRPRTAEISCSDGFSFHAGLLLQWGRRPRTAEMARRLDSILFVRLLQWGRRPRTAEIPWQENHQLGHAAASMGPPSEDGGNFEQVNATKSFQQLQWGRRPRTAEIATACFIAARM